VTAGQVIGELISRNSEAALEGARAMIASARTVQEREDARRALQLAEEDTVKGLLRSPEEGVVVSHAASQGDLVGEGDEIVGIAALGSIVFIAQMNQSDLPGIEAGQPAEVRMAAQGGSLVGTVRAILPGASSENFSAPVRIDFAGKQPSGIGLFGTALVTVKEHAGAIVAPVSAVLTDDVYGVSRIAVVTDHQTVHWVEITPGIRDRDRVEIVSPVLPAGTRVIVSGQVGLPEGAPLEVAG
jgi:membrane fusion protein (multidrug efflux system)